MIKEDELKKLRTQIDSVDEQIIVAIVKRLEYVKIIQDYKRKNNLSRIDKKREKEILSNRIESFKRRGMKDKKFAKEIFRKIIGKSIEK